MDGGQSFNASFKRPAADSLAAPVAPQKARIEPAPHNEAVDLSQGQLHAPGSSSLPPSQSSFDSPPLHLFRVTAGIPDYANEGFLGADLTKLVSGPIQWALISTKTIDWPWLLSACPALKSVPNIMLLYHKSAKGEARLKKDIAATKGMAGRVALYAPTMPKCATHHSKAFILQYKRGLRVIVHTANLMYRHFNCQTQGLFYQDFPLKDAHSPQTSLFEKDLREYFVEVFSKGGKAEDAAKVDDIIALHDFSAARVHLIASVSSDPELGHNGPRLNSFGHLKLKACLDQEPEGFDAKFSGAPVLAQYSSISNNATPEWLAEITASLSGGMCANDNGQRVQLGAPQGPEGIHLVWPSNKEIRESVEGWAATNIYAAWPGKIEKDFLQQHYRRWGGASVGRQRAMPHIKSFTRFDAASKEVAWMCFTSHNLSLDAWGEVINNSTALIIPSFELGVLLVPSLEKAYRCSRWYGFSCTDSSHSVGPMPGAQAIKKVRFVQWQRDMSQAASISGDGVLTVPLPVPYDLPPMRYTDDESPYGSSPECPGWDFEDEMGFTHGQGKYRGNKDQNKYGLLQSMSWADLKAKL